MNKGTSAPGPADGTRMRHAVLHFHSPPFTAPVSGLRKKQQTETENILWYTYFLQTDLKKLRR